MNKHPHCNYRSGLICSILLVYFVGAQAQSPSPLEVEQHPDSPEYRSLFPDAVLPLDTGLSWKNRFTGDESFNPQESLPPTSPAIDQQLVDSRTGSASEGGSRGRRSRSPRARNH